MIEMFEQIQKAQVSVSNSHVTSLKKTFIISVWFSSTTSRALSVSLLGKSE